MIRALLFPNPPEEERQVGGINYLTRSDKDFVQ